MIGYYLFAAVLALVALASLGVLLRAGRPREPLAWAGVAMSVALLCASIAVAILAQQRAAVPLQTLPNTPETMTSGPEVGQAAAPLEFTLLAGDRKASVADFKGRVVLLNFWATWCVPCLRELPDLDRLQADYGPLGLQVIALSDESPETLRAFGDDKLPQHATVAYLPDVRAAMPFYERGLDFRPFTYLIDRDGVVRAVDLGARDYEHFEERVQSWLQPNLASRR